MSHHCVTVYFHDSNNFVQRTVFLKKVRVKIWHTEINLKYETFSLL